MVASAAPTSSCPGPAEPSATFPFASRDGTALYGELFEVPAEIPVRGAVLVVHGYAEHCGRYRELAHVLTRTGFTTFTFDLRGHGRSAGARGHILRFEQYLEDVDAALAQLDARVPGEPPLAVVSHSHGGLITLRLLADPYRRPARVRAAVLSSPYLGLKLKVSPVKRLAANVIGRLMPSFSLPSNLPIETLTHDPDKLAERRVDTLCHDVAGARWFLEAQATQEWVLEFAPRVAVPTLWLVASDDALADPEASRAVQARVGGPSEWVLAEGLYHEVFNEVERGAMFGRLEAFLAENFPS